MTVAIAARTRQVNPDKSQGKPALTVFPILGPSATEPAYRLLEGEVLSAVKVTEVSESGSVPELRVENTLDIAVFLMDGQELVGAKQNRILNTDVLVPPNSKLTIPVSCVESGRWRSVSANFTPGKAANHAVRAGKSERVKFSLRRSGRHDADQGAVWAEVDRTMAAGGMASPTAALHDGYKQRQRDLDAFRSSLRLPDSTVGLAMFHGNRFLGLDLFDRHSTLVYFWQSLLESYAIDWLMAPETLGSAELRRSAGNSPADQDQPTRKMVADILERAAVGQWESFASPGLGRDYRLQDTNLTGSSLLWEEKVLLHLQLFPHPEGQRQDQPGRRPRIHRPFGLPRGDDPPPIY